MFSLSQIYETSFLIPGVYILRIFLLLLLCYEIQLKRIVVLPYKKKRITSGSPFMQMNFLKTYALNTTNNLWGALRKSNSFKIYSAFYV